MLKNLLIYRFLLLNLMAVLGGFVAWDRGWLTAIYADDFTFITVIITGLFLATWLTTLRRVMQVGGFLNMIKEPGAICKLKKGSLEKAWAKVEWLQLSSALLVGMGLLGTIIGFSHALSGVDESSLATSDGVSNAIGPLMEGMRVALNTTIAGTIFGMWNDVNQRMLRTAMTCLAVDNDPMP